MTHTFSKACFAVVNTVNVLTVSLQKISASPGPHFSTFVGKRAFPWCLSRTQSFDRYCSKANNCTHSLLTERAADLTGLTDGGFCTGHEQDTALYSYQLNPYHRPSLTLKQSKQEQSRRAMDNLSYKDRGMAIKGVLKVWDGYWYRQLNLKTNLLCEKH